MLLDHGGPQRETGLESLEMSKEEDNKAIVGRWFTHFWGKNLSTSRDRRRTRGAGYAAALFAACAAPRPCDDISAFATEFRKSRFPDLNFWGAAELIAEGDHVVGRWEGGGTHTGPAFSDFSGSAAAGGDGARDALHRNDGPQGSWTAEFVSEIGLDDGVDGASPSSA